MCRAASLQECASHPALPPGTQAFRLGSSPVCKSALGPPAHCQQGQREEPPSPVPEAGRQVSDGPTRWPLQDPRKPTVRCRPPPPCTPPLGACEWMLLGASSGRPQKAPPQPGNKESARAGHPVGRETSPLGSAGSRSGATAAPRSLSVRPATPSAPARRGEMPGTARATSTCPHPL